MKHRGHAIDLQAIVEADTDPYQIDGLALATVVDIGANIGTFTDRVKRLNPDATVYAYEAEQGNYDLLAENVGHHPNVKTFHGAVWSHDRGCTVMANYGCSETSDNQFTQPCESVTLDQIFSLLDHVDLVKVDTEGAEFQFFPAASRQTMEKMARIRMEIHYDKGDELGLRGFLGKTHDLVAEDVRPNIGGYWFWELK